jgi:hypothetical protein
MAIHLPTSRNRDDWQLALWNADDADVSRSQKLVFMLMLEAGFNNFDPFRVVGDLLRHRDLWEGVVMSNAFPMPHSASPQRTYLHGDLMDLRDIAGGRWHTDTVYLLHRPEHTAALTALAETWQADEIHTYSGEQAGGMLGAYGCTEHILRVWWD